MELSKDYLQSVFTYKDGNLYWNTKKKNCNIGDIAGCILKLRNDNRRIIVLDGIHYMASRLIFLFHHGYLPECVDHIDRNTLNDKIENLRAATKKENCRNKTSSKNSTSKYLGVWKEGNRFRSEICVDGKRKYIGSFKNEHDAAIAYNQHAQLHYGEFANLNVITT